VFRTLTAGDFDAEQFIRQREMARPI